jgi:hypothetical protein
MLPPSVGVVGISIPMGPQLVPALMFADAVRARRPDVRVVAGGPALSLMSPADVALLLAHNPSLDCVVRFDGELPLLALVEQAAAAGWDPAPVPGVSCRVDGGVHHEPPRPGLNLNDLPVPRYTDEILHRLSEPILGVSQARGCYWGKCDYCDFVELYDGGPAYRGRLPATVVGEIRQLVAAHGVHRFTLVTESIPPAFARRMSRLLLDGGPHVSWNSFAMVDRRFDRELMELMVESGCEFLVIGLETTVTRVLKLVHKSADREENFRFLRDARDAGLRLSVNLIPDLPSTTYAEAMRALADMESLADCLYRVSVFPFEATRSSNVGRDPARFGLERVDRSDTAGQSQYALNHLHNVDPAMTAAQRAEVHARYRGFADRINAALRTGDAGRAAARPGDDTPIRIPVQHVDLLRDGDRVISTDLRTRERAIIPPAAVRILEPFLSGQPFTAGMLRARAGTAAADRLMRNLLDSGLVDPAPAPFAVTADV